MSMMLALLIALASAVTLAAEADSPAPSLKLSWIDPTGSVVRLDWKWAARWNWLPAEAPVRGAPSPSLKVWIEAPTSVQLARSNRERSREDSPLTPSPGHHLLRLETQSPEETLRVQLGSASAGLRVEAVAPEPAMLIHESCAEEEIGLGVEADAAPYLLFVAVSCERLANGMLRAHVESSDDSILTVQSLDDSSQVKSTSPSSGTVETQTEAGELAKVRVSLKLDPTSVWELTLFSRRSHSPAVESRSTPATRWPRQSRWRLGTGIRASSHAGTPDTDMYFAAGVHGVWFGGQSRWDVLGDLSFGNISQANSVVSNHQLRGLASIPLPLGRRRIASAVGGLSAVKPLSPRSHEGIPGLLIRPLAGARIDSGFAPAGRPRWEGEALVGPGFDLIARGSVRWPGTGPTSWGVVLEARAFRASDELWRFLSAGVQADF